MRDSMERNFPSFAKSSQPARHAVWRVKLEEKSALSV